MPEKDPLEGGTRNPRIALKWYTAPAMRRFFIFGAAGLLVGVGCGLLAPYPGGEKAAVVLGEASGPGGESPLQDGLVQSPLVDPAIDDSITVVPNANPLIAIPGQSFVIDLHYVSQRGSVLGGGIQFPGSDRVQWTLIDTLRGTTSGDIRFAYAVPADICDDVANLCHEIVTKQFAVGANVTPGTDIDGDGEPDGQYVVSEPAEVRVVLRCASCESASCLDALPGGECLSCTQPQECSEAYDLCFAPDRPKDGTDEARQFQLFFGVDGIAWKTQASCSAGSTFCADALTKALDECVDDGISTDTE